MRRRRRGIRRRRRSRNGATLGEQSVSSLPATRNADLMFPSHLTPFAFIERLLEAEYPVWYRWDQDLPALLQELTAAAHREFQSEPKVEPGLGSVYRYRRGRRLFW